MIRQQAGRVINIGSTAGLVGDYLLPLYSTAKAAVHGFTRTLAKEVGQHNITVNCVAPYGTIAEDPACSRGTWRGRRTSPAPCSSSPRTALNSSPAGFGP
jgi:NAD(P)-dependent dehydrogenase (short-subunit alcohol dehydrogenase family)